MPRLSKIGAAALAAFGFSSGAAGVTASYLVVAGGGSGGGAYANFSGNAGGGGAGGLLTSTFLLSLTATYTITIGAGAASTSGTSSGAGNSGSNSVISGTGITTITTIGGGYGGGAGSGASGGSGGSGGGAGSAGGGSAGTGTSGQGNNGGATGNGGAASGGGGGAGAVGGNGAVSQTGAGGAGTASSITGSSVTYAGGGGGGGANGYTAGAGGGGGGGSGGAFQVAGVAGIANTGGGGGAGGAGNSAVSVPSGAGGSGIVIISYTGAQQFGGGTVTSSGGNTIHTFTTSGVLSPISSLSASYLIVAGGGGGGQNFGNLNTRGMGGGGAGGLLSGSGLSIDTNSTYTVTVGAGGAGGIGIAYPSTGTQPTNGSNSSFSAYVTASIGGGSGATSNQVAASGGSGGGGCADTNATGGAATASQGNAGGNSTNAVSTGGGGGGGATSTGGAVGGGTGTGGAGGTGTASSISGSSVTYSGGGGGGAFFGAGGSGGVGGGGAGGASQTAGSAGTVNLGGGGGGSGGQTAGTPPNGGSGGSGIVIISYSGSTQQMAGGTVTIVGGNVIHTFTSSGYLTPLTLLNNSLRTRRSASAWLSRSPTVAGNQQKWTWSGWVKRGQSAASTSYQVLFGCGTSTSNYLQFGFSTAGSYTTGSSDESLGFGQSASGNNANVSTNAVYRDYAAWYHIVCAVDTTQATDTNRVKIYVNGVQQSILSGYSYPAQNANLLINSTITHGLGYANVYSNYLDGYMANIQFIDGQALTPNSFGTFNSYGVWQPINYGGSYGTNGFYLPFTNNASTTTLGYDFSPQGNNWTTNNISVTAGSTYDSMTDVPTLTSATAANYCVISPISSSPLISLTNGNLTAGVTDNASLIGTMGVNSGKWYWEVTLASGSVTPYLGVSKNSYDQSGSGSNYELAGISWYGNGLKKAYTATAGTSTTANTAGVYGFALDITAGTLAFYFNNSLVLTDTTIPTSGVTLFPLVVHTNSGANSWYPANFNFGQQPFSYTPPSGFVALNTYNL